MSRSIRRLFVPACLCFAAFSAGMGSAFAQVGEQISGTWLMQQTPGAAQTTFEISSDGRYKTTVGGAVVETGTMTASGASWSLRSDAGRVDNGSFVSDAAGLRLKGQALTTGWTRHAVGVGTEPSTGTAGAAGFTGASGANGKPLGVTTHHGVKVVRTSKGGFIPSPGRGKYTPVMKDGQARKFWRGF